MKKLVTLIACLSIGVGSLPMSVWAEQLEETPSTQTELVVSSSELEAVAEEAVTDETSNEESSEEESSVSEESVTEETSTEEVSEESSTEESTSEEVAVEEETTTEEEVSSESASTEEEVVVEAPISTESESESTSSAPIRRANRLLTREVQTSQSEEKAEVKAPASTETKTVKKTVKSTSSVVKETPKVVEKKSTTTKKTTTSSKKKTTTAKKSDKEEVETVAMYRLYNPANKEHFYTSDFKEAKSLIITGWGKYEGVAWYAPKKSKKPVWRLYNKALKDHHYTTDKNEVNVLTSKHGWIDEGIAWYSDDNKDVKIMRAFHKQLISGSHNYTKDKYEQKVLTTQRGWRDEGVAWYGSNVKPDVNQDKTLKNVIKQFTWVTKNGKKYYTNPAGDFATGYQWIEGYVYLFDKNGVLQVNKKVTENGNTYTLDSKGRLSSGIAKIETAIQRGQTKVGKSPYVLGGGRTASSVAKNHFDCSSFVWWCFNEVGVKLGAQGSATTWTERNYGTPVSYQHLKRGDIFFMANIGHVGIYLGGGLFLHSSPSTVYSTVFGGKGQPNVVYTEYTSYYGAYKGGVGVSRLGEPVKGGGYDWDSIVDKGYCRRIILK